MEAKEFINSKFGDKNYTHSEFQMNRDTLEEWLNEFLELNNSSSKNTKQQICDCISRIGLIDDNGVIKCKSCKLPIK